jgi:hypothetical protein
MRAIVVLMSLGLAASPAAAEPTAPAKKKPAATAKKKAPAAKPDLGVSLGSMAKSAGTASTAEPPATPNGARRLDLTPARLFGKTQDPAGKKNEKTTGIALGDDRNWKVQAVQVGAMAAGFAALVALCGDGKCLLPFGGGDASDRLGPSPGLQISPPDEPRPAR